MRHEVKFRVVYTPGGKTTSLAEFYTTGGSVTSSEQIGEQLVPEKISAKRLFVSLLVKLLGNLVTKSSFRVVGIHTIVSKC